MKLFLFGVTQTRETVLWGHEPLKALSPTSPLPSQELQLGACLEPVLLLSMCTLEINCVYTPGAYCGGPVGKKRDKESLLSIYFLLRNLSSSFLLSNFWGMYYYPIFQVRKLRLRELKWLLLEVPELVSGLNESLASLNCRHKAEQTFPN